MAKNLEITVEMLKEHNACVDAINRFKEIFGEKVFINKNNIQKAAEKMLGGDDWVDKLLKSGDNRDIYNKFASESYKIWRDECDKDDHDAANNRAKCDERGVAHRLKCYTKFVELYRLENKAPKRKKKVSGEGRNTLEQMP